MVTKLIRLLRDQLQPASRNIYSEISPTDLNETYSKVSMFRFAAQAHHSIYTQN